MDLNNVVNWIQINYDKIVLTLTALGLVVKIFVDVFKGKDYKGHLTSINEKSINVAKVIGNVLEEFTNANNKFIEKIEKEREEEKRVNKEKDKTILELIKQNTTLLSVANVPLSEKKEYVKALKNSNDKDLKLELLDNTNLLDKNISVQESLKNREKLDNQIINEKIEKL